MKLFTISPLTQKRLQRFRRSRVAYWSLRLLILLYVISLCAELIANAKPLLMRFDGQWYFPFLHAQPPAEILKAADALNHVDYRTFTKSPRFTEDESNFVLFAPVPYSPGETLDTKDLEQDKVVTLSLVPRQPLGRFNLTSDLRIVREDSCSQFFPQSDLYDGRTALDQVVTLTPEIRSGIERRLKGEACPRETFTVVPAERTSAPWTELYLTLPENAAGQTRSTLRVYLRLPLPDGQTFLPKIELPYGYAVDEDGNIGDIGLAVEDPSTLPKNGAEILKTHGDTFLKWARQGFTKDITAADGIYWFSPSGIRYAVYTSNNIRFPFPPTLRHPFGLDGSGRDVFARILYATRIAVSFGLVLAVAATIIGLCIGSMQGYFGGKLDICVQRFTEIWAALPFLYIMILVGAIFGKSFWLLLLCYGLFCWLGMSYYMRAEFLRLRDRPFVDAARCQGLGHARIIFRHILPNALTPIITLFPFLLVGAISALVSLDFLGFGLPPLTPSWGELLNQAQTYRWAWWLILFPSLAIFAVMFLTVMVGEGVRNAFDPKPYSRLQ